MQQDLQDLAWETKPYARTYKITALNTRAPVAEWWRYMLRVRDQTKRLHSSGPLQETSAHSLESDPQVAGPLYQDRGPELQAWLTQFGCHHTSKGGNCMGGLDKKIISKNCSRIKPSQKHIWGEKSFLYNLICMGADQHAGLMRADLTRLMYTYAQPSYKKEETLAPQTCSYG
jgi:hypothetical protein